MTLLPISLPLIMHSTFSAADSATMLARVVQAVEPWHDAYSNSATIATGVLYLHLSALLLAGGLAISADRATLRTSVADSAGRARQLGELAAVHRTVVIALTAAFASGVLLLLADLESFLALRAFWIKMGLVLLLLINGAFMLQREKRLRTFDPDADVARDPKLKRVWSWLRVHAAASLALWFATLLAGTALTAG